MFYECHMHIFMNGENYRAAAAHYKLGVDEADIREKLAAYAKAGVIYLRDGGDHYGASALAAKLAPEYGITYRTPIFGIHKNGHYGKIVGCGFDTMKEYHQLVREAGAAGADFIKIMVSGILDFEREGALTESSLGREEIHEMIHIAHEEGFAVMAHTNGADAVRAVIDAGVDSIEHGNFMDEDCLLALRESRTIWVPTFVTIANLIGSGRYDDEALCRLKERQGAIIRKGFQYGVKIAPGSDAGAYRVPHVQGIRDEYRELYELCADLLNTDEKKCLQSAPFSSGVTKKGTGEPLVRMMQEEFDRKMKDAAREIEARFRRE